MRWAPFKMEERDLRNRVKNKMIRPTTIPQSMEELIFEQAVAKEYGWLLFNTKTLPLYSKESNNREQLQMLSHSLHQAPPLSI